jgi:hypothetical protein
LAEVPGADVRLAPSQYGRVVPVAVVAAFRDAPSARIPACRPPIVWFPRSIGWRWRDPGARRDGPPIARRLNIPAGAFLVPMTHRATHMGWMSIELPTRLPGHALVG